MAAINGLRISGREMTDFQQRFGELRSKLQYKPSKQQLRRIVEVFEHCPKDQLPNYLPYMLAHLAHWPDIERRVPQAMMEALYHHKEIPLMPLFTSITLHNTALHGLKKYLTHPQFEHIRVLSLSTPHIDSTRGFFALLTKPNCANVHTLLSYQGSFNSDYTDDGWLDMPLTNLQRLTVEGSNSAPILNSIADGNLPNIQTLIIQNCRPCAVNVTARLEAECWPHLKHLHIQQTHIIGDEPWTQLVSRLPETLDTLKWTHNALVTPEDIQAFVNLPMAHNLKTLDLTGCQLNALAIDELLARPWPNLRALILTSNQIGTAGVMALASTENLPALTTLKISPRAAGNRGRDAIEASTTLSEHIKQNWRPS